MTGGVVSTTTETDAVADFPDLSVAIAVSVAGPSERTSGPDWKAPSVPKGTAIPSTVTAARFASTAVPERTIGPGPRMAPVPGEEMVKTGGLVSTMHAAVAVALFPAASVAIVVRETGPSG